MSERLEVLRGSVARLRGLAAPLDEATLTGPSYDSEWSVADLLSHLGSGATIMRRTSTDAVAGTPTPDGFNQSVWDEWNAKSPVAQRDGSLAADQALLEALDSFDADQRAAFAMPMGPMKLDFDQAIGLRLSEHVVHTWDLEVGLDPSATIPAEAREVMFGAMMIIAGFVARPTGESQVVRVATTEPSGAFVFTMEPESTTIASADPDAPADLTLPADALIRLVYGRLDTSADATPELDLLHKAFPGF